MDDFALFGKQGNKELYVGMPENILEEQWKTGYHF